MREEIRQLGLISLGFAIVLLSKTAFAQFRVTETDDTNSDRITKFEGLEVNSVLYDGVVQYNEVNEVDGILTPPVDVPSGDRADVLNAFREGVTLVDPTPGSDGSDSFYMVEVRDDGSEKDFGYLSYSGTWKAVRNVVDSTCGAVPVAS